MTDRATQLSDPDGWALAGQTPPGPAEPAHPTPPAPPRGARGRGLGTLLSASLLSAVLASTGTVAILERRLGAAPAATDTPTANGRTVTTTTSRRTSPPSSRRPASPS